LHVSPLTAKRAASTEGGLLVVGDLHGSLASLHRILPIVDRVLGLPPPPPTAARRRPPPASLARQGKVIFLGDFVDRGPHSVEVLVVILLYRLAFPARVVILRGNHETERSRELGFEAELRRKYPEAIPVLNPASSSNHGVATSSAAAADLTRGRPAPPPPVGSPDLPPRIEEIVRSVRLRLERTALVARFEVGTPAHFVTRQAMRRVIRSLLDFA